MRSSERRLREFQVTMEGIMRSEREQERRVRNCFKRVPIPRDGGFATQEREIGAFGIVRTTRRQWLTSEYVTQSVTARLDRDAVAAGRALVVRTFASEDLELAALLVRHGEQVAMAGRPWAEVIGTLVEQQKVPEPVRFSTPHLLLALRQLAADDRTALAKMNVSVSDASGGAVAQDRPDVHGFLVPCNSDRLLLRVEHDWEILVHRTDARSVSLAMAAKWHASAADADVGVITT